MSWAATRQTTRTEDMAYCLMGIFDVHMPLLYGEGKKSFLRLQEEILKGSDDYSLFAWGLSMNIQVGPKLRKPNDVIEPSNLRGLFAEYPADFALSYQVKPLWNWTEKIDPIVTKGGVETRLPVWESDCNSAAAIPFTLEARYDCYLCMPLVKSSEKSVARWGELVLVPESGHISTDRKGKWTTKTFHIAPKVTSIFAQGKPEVMHFDISGIPAPVHSLNYILEDVYCLPYAQYSARDKEITLTEKKEGPHTILFFTQNFRDPEIVQPRDAFRTLDDCMVCKNITELNSRQPRFAVVLGRDKTDYDDGSWMKFVHILDEKKADQDFDFLLKRNPELVRCKPDDIGFNGSKCREIVSVEGRHAPRIPRVDQAPGNVFRNVYNGEGLETFPCVLFQSPNRAEHLRRCRASNAVEESGRKEGSLCDQNLRARDDIGGIAEKSEARLYSA